MTGSSAKTAFSREAATAGASVHITYGRENHSKPKRLVKKRGVVRETSPLGELKTRARKYKEFIKK